MVRLTYQTYVSRMYTALCLLRQGHNRDAWPITASSSENVNSDAHLMLKHVLSESCLGLGFCPNDWSVFMLFYLDVICVIA